MSGPRFSKGPWEVRPCMNQSNDSISSLDICLPATAEDTGVAVVASVWAEHHANANLIAAAPSLYEVLEVAANRFHFLATMQRNGGRPESKGNAAILERHAAECIAALAKARGE